MKVVKLVMCFVFFTFTFSCGQYDEVEQDKLIAVWNLKSIVSAGLDVPVSGCQLSQAITFNSNFTGSDYFPENDVNDPCDFETIDFSWLRDGDQLTIDSVQQGSFLVQIISLTDTQLQISVLENDDIPISDVQIRILKYEK